MAESRKKQGKKPDETGKRAPRKPRVAIDDVKSLAQRLRQLSGALESLAVDMTQQRVDFVQFDGSAAGAQGVKLLLKFVNRAGADLNDRLERV